MAKNDIILIDSIIQEKLKSGKCKDIGEAFEYIAREELFKDYDLSEEELENGWIDGKDDGGIDGIYFFVNGQIITDEKGNEYPKTNAELEIFIITCKHADTFKMDTINNLIPTLTDFFDLSKENDKIDSSYNSDLLEKRNILFKIYSNIAHALCNFKINIIYASRGDKLEVADNIVARSNKLVNSINKMFSDCTVNMIFYGSKEIIEMHRKKPKLFSSLKYNEIISQDNSYLILTTLSDYYNFVIDENQKLKRYFLDSNVRAYMGRNRVNNDICNTLQNNTSTDFWFLNNGITILSTNVTIIGKKINVENVQIINGLQTTETIYNYFYENKEKDDKRNILIKIIVSDEKELRDNIIKASNNQTVIELSALHATDKIQRDIEELLLKEDIYYERRTNFYANQGIEKDKICTPLYLAIGYISLIMKLPYKAVNLKSRFMNNPLQYNKVFSDQNDIRCYSNIIKILKLTDKVLEKNRGNIQNSTEKYLKSIRPILSLLTLAKIFNKFNFNEKDIKELDLNLYSEEIVQETLNDIKESTDKWERYNNWRKKDFIIPIYVEIAKKYCIKDVESITNRKNPFNDKRKYDITEEFIDKVRSQLPTQPWPVGTHTNIAKAINEPTAKVSQAIQILIKRGICYKQKNGKIYDEDGNIIN